MGLFSRKSKRDRVAQDSGRFYSKDDDAAIGERARSKRASHAGATAGAGRRQANDPMLPEKKRARRRLVGAIALALAAAVGLPMMLDKSPKPLAGDIAIQIPAKDKAPALPVPAAPVDAAASASIAAPLAAASSAAAKPQAAPRERSVTAAESVDRGEEVIAPPPVAKVETRKSESKPEAKPEPRLERKEAKAEHKDTPRAEHRDGKADTRLAEKAEKAVKPRLEEKPAKSHDDSARALAILENKAAEPKPQAASSQRFTVQVAAMSSQEKASELQARLRAAGISVHTEKFGELVRVKTGPLSRDEAEKVRAKLGKMGLSGAMIPG